MWGRGGWVSWGEAMRWRKEERGGGNEPLGWPRYMLALVFCAPVPAQCTPIPSWAARRAVRPPAPGGGVWAGRRGLLGLGMECIYLGELAPATVDGCCAQGDKLFTPQASQQTAAEPRQHQPHEQEPRRRLGEPRQADEGGAMVQAAAARHGLPIIHQRRERNAREAGPPHDHAFPLFSTQLPPPQSASCKAAQGACWLLPRRKKVRALYFLSSPLFHA